MTEYTKKKIIRWFWFLFFTPFVLLILSILGVWMFADIPSFKELENPDSKLATQVIAEDGEVLATFHEENRSYVSYNDLSPYLIQAAIATEDSRFYKHSGIDFRGLARVGFKTIALGHTSQGGGSTITQQLAKTLYPRPDVHSNIPFMSKIKMVVIKLKEWITAVKLERDYTKNEIMDMYLNAVFFGSGAFGVKSASLTFFGKLPLALNIQESATLVGMINKPSAYNPHLNPERSLKRRNLVISRMWQAGFITKAERDSLIQLPIILDYNVQDHNSGIAPYFRDMLRRYMNAKKPKPSRYQYKEEYSADSLKWENDQLYGWLTKNKKADGSSYNLDRDGLKIYTTINYKMQKYADQAVIEHLSKDLQPSFFRELKYKKNASFANNESPETIERVMQQARRWSNRYADMKEEGYSEKEILQSFNTPTRMTLFSWNKKGYIDTTLTPNDSIKYYKSFLRVGFMAIEPNTGHIKAYVGGPNYRYFKYDNVMQSKRQVGSVIKPFLYTLAMQEGMTPCTKVVNVPQTIIVGNDNWTPRSTDKPEWIGKTVDLRWGLTKSSNNISAYLIKQFGPEAMVQIMRKMGITSHLEPVPSICVGSTEISLYEMVAAYNVFPSKGVYDAPIFVTRIEDNQGNTIGEFVNRKREAIGENTAYTMVQLMQSVINNGTGARLRYKYNIQGEVGGKTGTTNDNSDGWFIAYTPMLTAGVWVGGEDRQIHFQNSNLGQGANMALPIWGIFYKKILADKSLGISNEDQFIAPVGYKLNCDDTEPNQQNPSTTTNNSYFD